MDEFSLPQRMTAEFLGTLWLVRGVCGSGAGRSLSEVSIGLLGVAFAFIAPVSFRPVHTKATKHHCPEISRRLSREYLSKLTGSDGPTWR